MAASVRVEDEAFSDVRYSVLATACHLADADHARGKMLVLWRQCTAMSAYVLPTSVIAAVLGENGASALIESQLGEAADGGIRIRGTRGRIEWLKKLRKNAQKGGKAKAAKRQTLGRQEPAKSLPPPFPPAPAPAPTQNPERERPSRDSVSPATESRWNRQARWWSGMLAAHDRLRDSGVVQEHADRLPPSHLGHERQIASCERSLRDSGYSDSEIDAKFAHAIAVGEAEAIREGHTRWFKPSVLFELERFLRSCDTTLDEARTARAAPKRVSTDRTDRMTAIRTDLKPM